MTEVSQRPRTAESAAAVVTEFFDRYRAHDVDGMTDLCSINADFSYVPVEIWGKQRVLRGDGKVCTVGKPLWTGLIASFPDLSNTVHSVTSNDDGDVVAQVDVEGTQQLAWGLIAPAGRHYREPHLFIFHIGADLLIDSIAAYWNDAGISQQPACWRIRSAPDSSRSTASTTSASAGSGYRPGGPRTSPTAAANSCAPSASPSDQDLRVVRPR